MDFGSDQTGGEGQTRGAKKDFLGDATLHIPANLPQSSTHLFDQSWAAPAAYRLLTLRTQTEQTCTRRQISEAPILGHPSRKK